MSENFMTVTKCEAAREIAFKEFHFTGSSRQFESGTAIYIVW